MPVVSERRTIRSCIGDLCGEPDDVVGRHFALQRAAERGRDPDLDTDSGRTRMAQFDDGTHFVDHLLARPAYVGERMRCASRYRDRDLVHSGIDGGFSTFHVRHQCHHRPIRQRHRVPHDVGGVGHLRQQLRRNERSDLDLAQTGRVQSVDPGELGCSRHRPRNALQAVARADFTDQYIGR
jgi:hypothetical protein